MRTECPEFEPLELDRAEELKTIINRAGRERQAVIIDPNERGITGSTSADLLSPRQNVNALVRYRRHY
ncbi:MAG TPA: hypothetical protein VG167_18365 [Verrucomicrobiae bacterium]|nr:hypothetical protein [Verrucomicrobiae bacterium]